MRREVHGVFVPEMSFDLEEGSRRLRAIMDEHDCVNIFISEGAGVDTIVKEMESRGEKVPTDAFGHYKLDAVNPGKWFAEQFDDGQWATVHAGDGLGYESQGFEGYTGYCWYRAPFDVPQTANKKHLYLYFSTVDEQAWVYINGEVAFEHTTQSTGMGVSSIWDLPFAEQVNESLRVGQSNLIAVRVHNKAGRGGITRPVHLLASDEALSLDQMTSLVKAFRSRAEDAAAP